MTGRTSRPLLFLVAVLGLMLAAYHPAWHGGMLWDDAGHLTRPDLQSLHGLWRIWFDVGATQQYYPVAHSAFWLQHHIFGDTTLGYHLVNIVLHATSTVLVGVILRRLSVPGAWLAALIFAVHPVQVESVAWMTELKNTLSGALYFGAALAYLQFDTRRIRSWYGLALALFVLAVLAKTVTATLPAALLVVFWWQRGRLRWREDVAPLVPFFVVGIAAGLVTAVLERTQIGAEGAAFQLTPIERVLIAGRDVFFYLGKLIWPAHLVFIYPRWNVSADVWWQFLFPLGVVALFAGLWWLRTWSRAPLAAMLFFCGTLVPALGFVNVYPFLFSFVADHFQYLAGLGPITLGAAGLAMLIRRWPARQAAAWAITGAAIVAPLTVQTWRQSHQYADAETLYRTTIARNPSCWMAHLNLGQLLMNAGKAGGDSSAINAIDAAMAETTEAVRLYPASAEGHSNLGSLLVHLGRPESAVAEYREALRLKPNDAEIHRNLAVVLARMGRTDEAIVEYRAVVQLRPADTAAHLGLGTALGRLGRLDDAIAEYRLTLSLDPSSVGAHRNLGLALLRQGRSDEAVSQFREAVRLAPASGQAHDDLGNALESIGRRDEALAEFSIAVRLQPDLAGAHRDLGVALAESGRLREAVAEFREALRLDPNLEDARANLARALAMLKGG